MNDELPPHEWFLVPWIPLTEREVKNIENGQRMVFRKLDPFDAAQVPAAAVYCGRCKRMVGDLGWGERDECRGGDSLEGPEHGDFEEDR